MSMLQLLVSTQGLLQPDSRMDGRSLLVIIYSVASLRLQPPEDWLGAFLDAMQTHVGSLSPQGVSMLLWSLASMRYRPDDAWLDAVASTVQRHIPCLGGQGLAAVLWGLAVLQYLPRPQLMQQLLAALHEVPAAQLTPVGILQVLQALAVCQHNRLATGPGHQAATLALANILLPLLAPHLPKLQPRELCNLLWALAKLRCPPPAAWAAGFQAGMDAAAPRMTTKDVVQLLWATATLRLALDRVVVRRLLSSTLGSLGDAAAEDICFCLWAASRLQVRPPVDWMRQATALLRDQLESAAGTGTGAGMSPSKAAMAALSLAKLGYRPPARLLAALRAALHLDAPAAAAEGAATPEVQRRACKVLDEMQELLLLEEEEVGWAASCTAC